MKKFILSTNLFLFLFLFASCKKEVNNFNLSTSSLSSQQLKSTPITDFGNAHNAILDRFYNTNSNDLTFWQKMTLIDQYMSEVNSNIQPGSFLNMLNANPTHKSNLELICKRDFNVSEAQSILQSLYVSNEISNRVNFYSNQIITCINSNNSNLSAARETLTILRINILNDQELNNQERNRLLNVISIGESSIEYWSSHNIPKYGKAPAWVGSDVTGGTTAITSGLASWASAFGPWGSFVVVVGSAAAASAFS
jgi:hypothetical protein